MKVICIKKDSKTVSGPYLPSPSVKEGEEYTVINSDFYEGKIYYRLEEIGYHVSYLDSLFAPLSDIDETEFERNYNKELQPK